VLRRPIETTDLIGMYGSKAMRGKNPHFDNYDCQSLVRRCIPLDYHQRE
jgi:hypothetical protein